MAKGEISKSYDDSTRVYVNNEGLEGGVMPLYRWNEHNMVW